MKYIVVGPTIVNDILFADGSKSTGHIGGSIFCLEGVKIWEDSCLYISNVGEDFSAFYGQWMQANHCTCEGLQYILPHTQYTELLYGEDGLHSEQSVYGAEEEEQVEKLDYITASQIAQYCGEDTKGIYIEASETNPFWEELDIIRTKSQAKIMWEMPTSAAMTPERHKNVYECIKKADMYSINLPEAKSLFSAESEAEAIEKIKAFDVPCFFRVGKKGSYMIAGGETSFASSVVVGEVADSTGCGNCSTAAAMYACCEGSSLYDTARMANIAAAYNLLQYGPYPVLDEIREEARKLLYGQQIK